MVKIFVCSRGGKPVSTFNWVIEYKPIPPEILNKPIRTESNLLADQKSPWNQVVVRVIKVTEDNQINK